MRLIKKLIFFIIIVILVACLGVGAYLTYVDSNANGAKDYLLDKYELDKKEWIATNYTEYVYEDIADCNSLWLKKCTSDKELHYKYTFRNKSNETIIVSEDNNGKFTDDYNGKLREKEENNIDNVSPGLVDSIPVVDTSIPTEEELPIIDTPIN